MQSYGRIRRTVAVVALVIAPTATMAQAPPAGVQQAVPNRDQIVPPALTTTRPPSSVRVDSGQAIIAAPCPLETSNVAVNINIVRFTGLDGAPLSPELAGLLAGVAAPAGTQQVKVVCSIRDEANTD